jgi:phosphoserine phosphatase
MDKSVAVLDWDNSLRDGWLIVDWAEKLSSDGLLAPALPQGLRALLKRYKMGQVSYQQLAETIPQRFAEGLAGLSVKQITTHAEGFVTGDPVGLRPFALDLISALRLRKIAVIFVSGAPQEILATLLKRYGAAEAFGTIFAHADGKYTGVVSTSRASQHAKAVIAHALQHRGLRIVVAVGDSGADVPILTPAVVPVVVGNPDLAATIDGCISLEPDADDIGDILKRLDGSK